MQMYRDLAPSWWDGIDGMTIYDFTEYLRCVFLESDVDVAVLTSNPGVTERRMLLNDELAGTRELFDRLAGTGRLLNHAVVHPNLGESDDMERLARPLQSRRVEGVHARQARRRRCGSRRGDSTTTTVTGSSTKRSGSACRWCARTRASRTSRPRGRPRTWGPRRRHTRTSTS